MRGFLLDTNVVSALISPRGAPSVKNWLAGLPEDVVYISVLTLAEYDKGIHNLAEDHPDRFRYGATRDALELRFADRVLALGSHTVRRWGRISGDVKRTTGHAPPVVDTLLAATALDHDLYLATRNTRDVRSTGAALFDPWTDDPARFPIIVPRHWS